MPFAKSKSSLCNNWKIRYNDFMDKDILDKVRYSTDQLQEIEEGQSKGLEKEISKGLEGKLEYSQKIWLKDTG